MTENKTRRQYTKEFKLEAVELAKNHEGSAAEVARNLGIPPNVLYRWMSEYESNEQNAFPGLGNLKDPADELRRLRKELAEAKMERDILKKALSIFSRQSSQSSSS
jgi:transposase